MTETYVTYLLWDGCRAPGNLECNGRLCGQRVSTVPFDRDALLKLANELDSSASMLLKQNDLDPNRKRRGMRRDHAKSLMAASGCIREALGEVG